MEIPPAETHGSHVQFLGSTISARPRRTHRLAIFTALILLLLGPSVAPEGAAAASKEPEAKASEQAAEVDSREQMRSLDEQVQEVKSEVLAISAELGQLEEKLLFPSNTQVALFVSVPSGETSQLDSVRIQIDGELVAHHIYSFKELEALKKGGVQRVYTGNVSTGAHELGVTVAGKLAGGSDFGGTQSFSFTKEVEPKLIGLELAGQASGEASVQLGGL